MTKTTNQIRVRTQSGHRLYLHRCEMYVPGEETTLEVSDAILEHFVADGRVMIDKQIDDYNELVAGIPNRVPAGTRMNSGSPREIPDVDPVNAPGGTRLPGVKPAPDSKSAKELRKIEKASQRATRGPADGAPVAKTTKLVKGSKKGRD